MGYDSTNHLPKGTRRAEVEGFLVLLDYEKLKRTKLTNSRSTPFSYWPDQDYRYLTGVYAEVASSDDGGVKVWTHTTIWRSKFDADFHNSTIQQLKKRFGGYFISDYGKNRYFRDDAPIIEKAEAGCYAAYSRFHGNLVRARVFLSNQSFDKKDWYPISQLDFIDSVNPKILSTNLVVPFLVSIIEDYFRSTYVALLRYSEKKASIFQNARLGATELLTISKGQSSVEEAVARWRSFQDMKKVCDAFKELDKKINLHGVLSRPYRRRKETPLVALERLIEQRHELIHQAEINSQYYPERVNKDVNTVDEAIKRVYRHLVKVHGWTEDHPDL